MSLATQRQALADTLDAIEGVKGYLKRPRSPKTGDAWPILPRLDLVQDLIWQPTFRVLVVLPNDEYKASEWLDEHFGPIVIALREGPAFPESAELGVYQTEAGDIFLLDITLKTTEPEL